MKKYLLALVAIFVLSGCSALKVQTDYDEEFDFKSLSKFSIVYTKKDDSRNFTRDRISKSLSKHFENKGYSLVPKNEADFTLAFNLDFKKTLHTETNYETIVNYPPILNSSGLIVPDTALLNDPLYLQSLNNTNTIVTKRTYEYEEGRLIVELIDIKTQTVVWQGVAIDEFRVLDTQEEKKEYIDRVIGKLLKDYPL